MIYQLKNANANQFPSGGWPFKDPKTGFTCQPHEGTPAMHAVKIAKHRRGNPNLYPQEEAKWFDIASIVQEIYAQKAATHPHLFKGYHDAVIIPQKERVIGRMVAPMVACKCGSNDFEPVYCKTCSGKRVTGWKCKSCGKELKK